MSLVFKNNVVACLPFTEEQLKPKKATNLNLVGVRGNSLLELFVWHGTELTDDKMYVGNNDVVLVRSTSVASSWAKDKFTIDGFVWEDVIDPKTNEKAPIEFILVPLTEIVAIDRDAMSGCGCDCEGEEEKEPPKVN
jgi:hypothetical protein